MKGLYRTLERTPQTIPNILKYVYHPASKRMWREVNDLSSRNVNSQACDHLVSYGCMLAVFLYVVVSIFFAFKLYDEGMSDTSLYAG